MAGDERAAGLTSRKQAAQILIDIFENGQTLDQALGQADPSGSESSGRDAAFVRRLVMTVLRRRGQIDAILLAHLSQGFPKKAGSAIAVLRLGAAELLFLDHPAHAVLHSCVELVSASPKVRHLKKLTNAVLRRVSESVDGPLADVRENIASWIFERWSQTYGADIAEAMAEALVEDPPLDVTVKYPRLIDRLQTEFSQHHTAEVLPTGSLRLRNAGRVTELPGFSDGTWWVQDAAAALPVRLLGDVTDKQIVDLCAAPGGKTLQLAAAGARVTAVDLSEARLALVQQNLVRTGLAADLIAGDGAAWQPGFAADCVLLDAPCSATGTARRHPDVLLLRRPRDLERLCTLQKALLDNAARMLQPGGVLIYCTCSLEPEENEQQVAAFLERMPSFSVRPITFDEVGGCGEFVSRDGFLRTLPCYWRGRGGLDGFFAARLVKSA